MAKPAPQTKKLSAADEETARRLFAATAIDIRTVRRYLRGENVMRSTRIALETAFRAPSFRA